MEEFIESDEFIGSRRKNSLDISQSTEMLRKRKDSLDLSQSTEMLRNKRKDSLDLSQSPIEAKIIMNGEDIGVLINLQNNNMSGYANNSEYQSIIESLCDRLLLTRINTEKNLDKYKRINENDISIKCLVCMEFFKEGMYKRTLKCSHVFHKKCIDKWIKLGNYTCPCCRKNIYN